MISGRLGSVVSGSLGVWELRSVEAVVYGVRCVVVVYCGNGGVWESRYAEVTVSGIRSVGGAVYEIPNE